MDTLESTNPYSGKLLGTYPKTSDSQISKLCGAANSAHRSWRCVPLEKRGQILSKLCEVILDRGDYIIQSLIDEVGMVRQEAESSTLKLNERIAYLIKNTVTSFKTEDQKLSSELRNIRIFEPLGVIGIIMPWNHPFTLPFWSIIPALMAGNGVVYKPSEYTPLIGSIINELFETLELPANLFSMILGDRKEGELLVKNSNVSMVCFAGSIEVGKRISIECSNHLKKVILENGGKDPMIIDKKNDAEKIAQKIILGVTRHSGQLCSNVRRVLVHEDIHDEVLDRLKQEVFKIKVGDPNDINVTVGPVKTRNQVTKLTTVIEDARLKGATIFPKNYSIDGHQVRPCVISNTTPEMKISSAESLGPIIVITKTSSISHAIQLANDSEYGLNASVWSKNLDLCHEVAKQLVVGTVTINLIPSSHNACSWHGVKKSGAGTLLTKDAAREFARIKNIRTKNE